MLENNRGRVDRLRVLIAAGGTGGHVLPALEVAHKIETHASIPAGRLRIEFVGVGRAIEKQLLEATGYTAHSIQSSGLKGKGFSGSVQFLRQFPTAFGAVRALLSSYKPDVVAGFGGYPSVLPIITASFMGIPTWIHEADAIPGWATKFLSLWASEVSTSFDALRLPFGRQARYTGHPVRSSIVRAKVVAPNFQPSRLLVLGGSQGSEVLDSVVPNLAARIKVLTKVHHQARSSNCAKVVEAYAGNVFEVQVSPYIEDITQAYQSADLIVSRAGAGALSELARLNKPVIFIPLSHVSGHQLHNAKTLERLGKALIVEEGDNFELRLEDAIGHLMEPSNYRAMMEKPPAVSNDDPAQVIADGIVALGLNGAGFN